MRRFRGRVKSGAGKATRNIGRARDRLLEATGVDFEPGTLNLILDQPIRFANQIECRTWGLCPIRVNGVKCFALRSLRKDYPRPFIEVVSSVRLRDRLKIQDGSAVTVEIDPLYLK